MKPGKVMLVGAGPGDPELLTVKAVKALQSATVVLVDDLVSDAIVALAHPAARVVYVGKRGGCKSTPQAFIQKLMIAAARDGDTVVRLKGGDPFIFGRGGEELETLADNGIPFEVVPGVSAANGVAAYAGIPLTHRDHAQVCVFVTGHLKDGTMDLDWDALACPRQTIVVYMGLQGLATLCRELVAHGLRATTPAAIVQQGTTAKQRVVVATLATLPEHAKAAALVPPTLIIVGEVVRLQAKLAWFEPAAEHARSRPGARHEDSTRAG